MDRINLFNWSECNWFFLILLADLAVASTLILSLLKMTMKMSMHLSFRVEIRTN